jgi:hypothetical protein
LVGIVILLQGLQDLQPALILIGTTLRLAHKIGLHNRTSSLNLDPLLVRQRACVFWMAYILDKDIAMRSNAPSVQSDDDIDLDLPAPAPTEFQPDDATLGIVTSADGIAHMNFFLSRIQLAVIQGGVYDYLYSTRAQKRIPEERSTALESLRSALAQWKTSIPPEFTATAAITRLPPDLLRFFRMLHATSLACTALITQASSCNTAWVGAVRSHARSGTIPSLAPCWQDLLEDSRELLTLFEAAPVKDSWTFW